MSNNVKFRLIETNGIYNYNCEYTARQNLKHPEITYVFWHLNGQLHKISYNTKDIEKYFSQGLWIKI